MPQIDYSSYIQNPDSLREADFVRYAIPQMDSVNGRTFQAIRADYDTARNEIYHQRFADYYALFKKICHPIGWCCAVVWAGILLSRPIINLTKTQKLNLLIVELTTVLVGGTILIVDQIWNYRMKFVYDPEALNLWKQRNAAEIKKMRDLYRSERNHPEIEAAENYFDQKFREHINDRDVRSRVRKCHEILRNAERPANRDDIHARIGQLVTGDQVWQKVLM